MSGKSPRPRRAFHRIQILLQKVVSWLAALPQRPEYLAALGIQLLLFPFGHSFDTRVFFGTAAGVAHGMSPYSIFNLGDYYRTESLVGPVPGIGYAPPWALFLAAMYGLAYVPTENPFALNLAIKVPIILSNLLLARFVRKALETRGCSPPWARRAELLVLFNPFLYYTSSFWNMYDTLVALLFLMSLDYLDRQRPAAAGLALGASIALKHLAIPLVPIGWLWIATRAAPSRDRARALVRYNGALLVASGILVLLPFLVFQWPFGGFAAAASYQAQVSGGFSIFRFLPTDFGSSIPLALLGYLPAMAVVAAYAFLYRTPLVDFGDLSQLALVIMIVFMTTRTWVSEQNLAMIFPLVLVPELLKGRGFRLANALGILFLVYAVVNSIPLQFAFLLSPSAPALAESIANSPIFGPLRQLVLPVCVVVWLALGWSYVVKRT